MHNDFYKELYVVSSVSIFIRFTEMFALDSILNRWRRVA